MKDDDLWNVIAQKSGINWGLDECLIWSWIWNFHGWKYLLNEWMIVDWGLVKVKLESRIERGASPQSPNGGCGPYMNVIDGESSKARGERWLSSGLNVVSILLQNRDCKHQIDVIDMVGSKPVIPLEARREDAKVPRLQRHRGNLAFGVGDNIHRRNSNIALANAARRVREKSGEVLAFIHILYSFLATLSIPLLSSKCQGWNPGL